MKTVFFYTIAIILFIACKKDKEEDKITVTGYYQGYVETSTGGSILNIGILHRSNSTSRLYQFQTGIADTTQINNDAKTDGVWSLNGKAYHCIFSKNNYTVTFEANITAPGNTIEGNFNQSGAGSMSGTFVLNKK